MKYNYLIIALIGALYSSAQQAPCSDSCIKKNEQKKKAYFNYNQKVLDSITNNWGMCFKGNVASEIDPDSKNYMFEIKLDSYGCLYPVKEIVDVMDKKKFDGKIRNFKALTSHSFYRHFTLNEKVIKDKIDKYKLDKRYDTLIKLSYEGKINSFCEKWDELHHPELTKSLNAIINDTTKHIKKVIFFIHGYNVPYGLAALQAVTLYKIAKDTMKQNMSNTLLVPVYWPSNNAKEKKIDVSDSSKFSTYNTHSYQKNGRLFLGYSNRCYYAAITLRKIINDLPASVNVDIITHSLGATVATSALINTYSKLQYNKRSDLRQHAGDSAWIIHNTYSFSGNDEINSDILKHFYQTPLPKRPIRVFLSAAAIPGLSTFQDADSVIMKNKEFYVTVNPCDEMVSKSDIRKSTGGLSAITAAVLSSTTLGCNYACEACNTKIWYDKHVGKSAKFYISRTGNNIDHDVFTYIQQKGYQDFFKGFLNGTEYPKLPDCLCPMKKQ